MKLSTTKYYINAHDNFFVKVTERNGSYWEEDEAMYPGVEFRIPNIEGYYEISKEDYDIALECILRFDGEGRYEEIDNIMKKYNVEGY